MLSYFETLTNFKVVNWMSIIKLVEKSLLNNHQIKVTVKQQVKLKLLITTTFLQQFLKISPKI